MLKIYILVVLVTNSVRAKNCGTDGAFCGRGINRVDCCTGYHCEIAPNDSSAKCVADLATSSCGTTGAFCGRGLNSVDCCEGFYCNIAANDSTANCTPNSQ